MNIKSVKFICSFPSINEVKKLPPLPTVAFIGRSNVGKSTFINTLLNSKGIAKTSRMPGKTRLINYFLVNEQYYFVDLPGYGFAKVPPAEQRKLKEMIREYLVQAPQLKLVVQLFDIRHKPSAEDIDHFIMIMDSTIPVFALANKSDKISKNDLKKSLQKIKSTLQVEESATPFSNLKKDNLSFIRNQIFENLS